MLLLFWIKLWHLKQILYLNPSLNAEYLHADPRESTQVLHSDFEWKCDLNENNPLISDGNFDWMIDFNRTSTRQGLFYAQRLENRVYGTFIST